MKKFLLIVIVFLLAEHDLLAQPQIMNYQGVARDKAGMVIANQPIALKISILENSSTGPIVFSEIHHVTTSQFGVFSLKIGTGEALLSTVADINWGGSDHYIQVEMDASGGENYELMGTSQLLSVPYAFHALTAGELTGRNDSQLKAAGIPSQTWSLFGNSETDPTRDRMGTTDDNDLVFITNNEERLRITSEGKLITPAGVGLQLGGNLQVQGDSTVIDKDLYVGRNVFLNTNDQFNPHGQTINYGNFTVEGMSSTMLTGDLTVDGETNLNDKFSVNNMSPSLLSGTLTVEKDALFNQKVTLDNSSLGSTDPSSGALVVAGGAGIGENLNIEGNLTTGGTADIMSTTGSNSTSTGALTVGGGAGVAQNLYVGGAVNIGSTLNVTGNSTVTRLNANGQVTVNASLGTPEGTYSNYPLQVEGSQQGIAVKLTPSDPGRSNNFISFWGGDGSTKGRIEGMQGLTGITRSVVASLVTTPDFGDVIDNSQSKDQAAPTVTPNQYFNNDYAYGAYSLTLDFVTDIVRFAVNAIGASGLCVSGDCDDVVWSAVDVVVGGLQLGGYIAYNEVNRGVAFESGGADYAEWLMKNNPEEAFTFGDVVGVNGGVISKEFKTAEKYMVISKDPTVIGAMPEENNTHKYERIAFMGQVPVKVIGVVKKGDYILPSGNNDGMAIAVTPGRMAALDYARIIGTAWGESDGKKLFEYVNTAVGINANDMAGVISNMQSLLNEMQIALNSVVPDYQPKLYASAGSAANLPADQFTKSQSLRDLFEQNSDALQYNSMEEALGKARNYAEVQGFDLSQYPYLAEIFDNPSPELAEEMLAHYTKVLNNLNAIMANMQRKP